MINKFKKIINNKFSRFFKFIFFLRYLLAIFFFSIVLFLFIPQFFDYKKKEKNLVSFLSKYYGLEIQELNNIKFKSLPTPHLEIDNVIIKVKSNNKFLNTKKLIIYPRILSIYNFNNFLARKVKLETSDIQTNLPNLKALIKNIFSLENKVSFQDLNIEIKEDNKHIMDLKKNKFF